MASGVCFDCCNSIDKVHKHHLDNKRGKDSPVTVTLCPSCHLRRHAYGQMLSYHLLPEEKETSFEFKLEEISKVESKQIQQLKRKFKKEEINTNKLECGKEEARNECQRAILHLYSECGIVREYVPISSYARPIWNLSPFSFLKPEAIG